MEAKRYAQKGAKLSIMPILETNNIKIEKLITKPKTKSNEYW